MKLALVFELQLHFYNYLNVEHDVHSSVWSKKVTNDEHFVQDNHIILTFNSIKVLYESDGDTENVDEDEGEDEVEEDVEGEFELKHESSRTTA